MSAVSHNRGFTLIEIMITIVIISVTFGIIITSASSVRKSGRDGQRQSDILSLKAALQQFYADQNYFPNNTGSATSTNISSWTSLTNCTGAPTNPVCIVSKTYLPNMPSDPSGVTYKYKPKLDGTAASTNSQCNGSTNTNQCHYYILCAALEGTSPQSASQNSACTDSTNGFGSAYNFQANP
jgi:prepilin-type N-terminal cleavage/methylation domain-containing protein